MLDDNELREISVVTIPANPEALAKAKAKALETFRATAPVTPAKPPTDPAAERGQLENTMSLEIENAALKSKMAERDGELAVTKSKLADAEKSAAEFAKRDVEKDTKIKALESQTDHLVKERDAEKAARELAEGQLIDLEVGGLVGKKIAPSEKDLFVQLRKSNKSLFDGMVAQRGDMPHEKQVIPPEPNGAPPAPTAEPTDDADFAAFAKSVSAN